MKVAIAILCVVAVSYFLRVLAAMVHDMKRVAHRPLKIYLSKFQPSRLDAVRLAQLTPRSERGELIVTTSDAQQHKFPLKIGENGTTWYPDLRKTEDRATMAILVKF